MLLKKMVLGILVLTFIFTATFVALNVTSVEVEAAPAWCNDWYVDCIDGAGDNTSALNRCLAGWMWCAGY